MIRFRSITFQVLIQHSDDQPDPVSKGFAVSPGNEVFAAVTAWYEKKNEQKLAAKPSNRKQSRL